MLKHLIRFRIGWWILHIVAISIVFWLGHLVNF
jgi:hypothetical protein